METPYLLHEPRGLASLIEASWGPACFVIVPPVTLGLRLPSLCAVLEELFHLFDQSITLLFIVSVKLVKLQ